MTVKKFISGLRHSPKEKIFNPWFDQDSENDALSKAPLIRRNHLSLYLEQRLQSARYLFIAEAAGYQGAHFSGIPLTSERILLGFQGERGIKPEQVFKKDSYQRTSSPEIRKQGFNEPTATIAWETFNKLGIDPYEAVFWNAFPWHPYDPSKGFLSNRTPTGKELNEHDRHLKAFLALFPGRKVLAVGRISAAILKGKGVNCTLLRHPSYGGKREYVEQLQNFMEYEKLSQEKTT